MGRPVVNTASYVATKDLEYRYPGAGDPRPPGGAAVLLLTVGGICVRGYWSDDRGFLGWAPMPGRNREKELLCKQKTNG